jgi:type III restriction enzyme
VNFNTSKTERWETDARKCHVNFAILDSGWEGEFCRVVEGHHRVRSYVKNHHLGLEVPYSFGAENKDYLPDFIVRIDDGHGEEDLLNLVVEIKGYRAEDAVVKKTTMDTYWIPGVNNLKTYGRWAFVELKDLYTLQSDFSKKISVEFNRMIETVSSGHARKAA